LIKKLPMFLKILKIPKRENRGIQFCGEAWVGARHRHPHEQIVYVVSGRLQVTIAGQMFEIGAGDSFVVRGGVEHQASALDDSVVIDVFTPCRNDYL